GQGEYDIVRPPLSILAEPPVSIVDANVQRHGTREVAMAYLQWLYSEPGQEIVARHHYRPRMEAVEQRHAAEMPPIQTFTLEHYFGDWRRAQRVHFADGGVFDQIYQPPQG